MSFKPYSETLAKWRRQDLLRHAADLPLRHRWDVVFRTSFGALAATLALAAFVLIVVGRQLGFFDPPLVRPVPDERLLTNVRHGIVERPLLAAASHRGRLYVSQQGRVLHRYDPATELWTTPRLDSLDRAIASDFVALRSACAADPLSHRRAECADSESLWALTAAGGLARLRDGEARAIVGETAFRGAHGELPASADLTAAALSDDGRWLVLGTNGKGVGLYDQQDRFWVPLRGEVFHGPPFLDVSHARWWNGRFWLGGTDGFGFLVPGPKPSGGVLAEVAGSVQDLEAGEELRILSRPPCRNSEEESCHALRVMTSPERPPELVLDTGNRYRTLDLGRLSFAQKQRDVLVLAGEPGLFTYDARLHTWERHVDRSVLATLATDGAVYAGTYGGVLRVLGTKPGPWWELGNQRVLELAADPARRDAVLARTDSGDVYSLPADGAVVPVLTRTETAFDPSRFDFAVALGDTVLFRGPEGALLHDVRERSYRDVARTRLPGWLYEARLHASGTDLYGILATNEVRVADPGALARGRFHAPGRLTAPARSAVDWQGRGLVVTTRDGGVYRADPSVLETWVGPRIPGLDQSTIRDVAVRRDTAELLVATDQGLRSYVEGRRAWNDKWQGRGIDGGRFRQVEVAGGEVLVRTAEERLARIRPSQQVLIGAGAWPLDGVELTDVLEHGGRIFLGGGGRVLRYDPSSRRSQPFLPQGARGDVDLVASTADGTPLWRDERQAYLGGRPLPSADGRILGLWEQGSWIWTLRETVAGRRYLRASSWQEPFRRDRDRCFFRHPTAGPGRVVDAVELDRGRLAVLTTEGLKLYHPGYRSWYAVLLGGLGVRPDAGTRLHRLGNHLLVLPPAGDLLLFPAAAFGEARSCGDATVRVKDVRRFPFRAVALDPGDGAVAWIPPDGGVMLWRDGRAEEIVAAALAVPEQRLRAVFGAVSQPGVPRRGLDGLLEGPAVGFLSDRLRTATEWEGRLHVTTEAFLEVADGIESLAAGQAERRAPAALPRPRAAVAETARLRFRIADRRLVHEILLDDPRGGDSRWVRSSLPRRGFRFDRVLSIASFADRLFVKTDAGLQVFPAGRGVGLDDLEGFYDLGALGGGGELVRPFAAPDRLFVHSADRCLEWRGKKGFESCPPGWRSLVTASWRGASELWSWRRERGTVRGVYEAGDRREARLRNGHFPHDDLEAVVVCGDRAASLAAGGRLTLHPSPRLDLAGAVVRGPLPRVERLLCLGSKLYAVGGQRFYRLLDGDWRPVENRDEVGALAARLDPPPLDRRDLRLRDRRPFRFERREAGRWIELPGRTDASPSTT